MSEPKKVVKKRTTKKVDLEEKIKKTSPTKKKTTKKTTAPTKSTNKTKEINKIIEKQQKQVIKKKKEIKEEEKKVKNKNNKKEKSKPTKKEVTKKPKKVEKKLTKKVKPIEKVKKVTKKTVEKVKKEITTTKKHKVIEDKKDIKINIDFKKISIKIKIMLLSICKVFLIICKKVTNFIVKIYNNIKIKFKNKKKKEKKAPKEKTPKALKKEEKKRLLNEEDELNLLRYRDYKGFAWISVFFINRIRVIKFDMKRFNKKFKYGTFKDRLLIILMLILIAGFSCIIAFCVYIVATAPEISEKRLYKQNSSVFLDINRNVFARRGTENREKVSYEEIPEVLVDAIVSAEDSRFFQHNGIDIARFSVAVFGQLLGRSDAGGGSTLTMQLSKNTATSTMAHGIKGIVRKFQDIYLSVFVFEKKFTKEQIMEFYVNINYLGAGAHGVQQASKAYFGKEVSDLTLTEAATIAGLFQSPDAYDPYQHPLTAEKRRNTILNLMERHGYISKEERDAAKEIPLSSLLVGQNTGNNKYQGFIDTVTMEVRKRTGYDPNTVSMTIQTTMDPTKQDVVNGVMTGEKYKWKNDYAQAGIAVVSVKDGSIVAVGANRTGNQLEYNFATQINRHPGSTAKPVLDYGPAIEYLNWSTGTTIIDDKMTYSGGGYIKNFDAGFKGIMTAKTALAQSRNIPALYTFQQTTNEQKLEFSNNLGWHAEDKTGYIVESASIGGFNGVNPLQSAAAFATFARGGTYIEPYSYTKATITETGEELTFTPKKVQAMSEETAYIISMILRYAVTSGSVGAGSVPGTDLCAKTGTSTIDAAKKKAAGIKGNLIGDSWTVAFSPDYAISTWYGYKEQYDPEYHLTNGEGGTARKTITKILTEGILPKNSKFKKPSGVVMAEIELETDPLELASPYTPSNLRSTEYFKKGTVPSSVSNRFAQLSNPSNLKYSSSGTQITLTWKAAPTPDAINIDYLTNYFNNNVYQRWADKYLQQRIDYNNSTFGAFGYEIYMTNSLGTYDLGFTTNTTFTTNQNIDANTTFTVKASYQYFKSNQSPGIQTTVTPNTSTIEKPTQETADLTIRFTGGSGNADWFKNLGDIRNHLTIKLGDAEVTRQAAVSTVCRNDQDQEVNCNDMVVGQEYTAYITATFSGKRAQKQVQILRN